jgi:hypothetical protein
VEIPSDATLAEAVWNKIISAPVWNVDAPEDASWIDRYIGIVVWLLHQSEAAAKAEVGADELAMKLGTVALEGAAAIPFKLLPFSKQSYNGGQRCTVVVISVLS